MIGMYTKTKLKKVTILIGLKKFFRGLSNWAKQDSRPKKPE
jgi:hypothetical protein